MRRSTVLLAAIVVTAATHATAQDSLTGTWLVKGRVAAFAFSLVCKFDQRGEGLSGTCYDAGSHKAHPLTTGHASGDKVGWTYQSTYLFHPFDAVYAGVREGGVIRGTVVAPGYSGQFMATRP